MSIKVTRNPNNSYTIECGGESVTVGGDPSPSGGSSGSGGGGGGGGGAGSVIPTPTRGPAAASIVESPEGQRVGLRFLTEEDLVDPELGALWLRVERLTGKPMTTYKKPGIVLGWEGLDKIDIGKLGVELDDLGLGDTPLVIRGLQPKDHK